MKKIKVLKTVSSVITSFGIGTIIGNGVKMVNEGANINPFMKVCVTIGTFAISGMVSDKATEYIDGQIDALVDSFKKIEKEDEEPTEKGEENG